MEQRERWSSWNNGEQWNDRQRCDVCVRSMDAKIKGCDDGWMQ